MVNYHPIHLTAIQLKAIHEGEKPKAISGPAVTLLSEGRPIAIFGGIFIGSSVFHLWGLVSEEVKKTPISFYKTCQKLIHFTAEKYGIKRFQIDIRESFTDGPKWAHAIGFKLEGRMTAFGSTGEDHFLFGRAV